jgi:uncharacterized protein YeaO (DUF488 family)
MDNTKLLSVTLIIAAQLSAVPLMTVAGDTLSFHSSEQGSSSILLAQANSGQDRLIQKVFDKLDKAVEKVEKALASGKKPDSHLGRLEKSIKNNKIRYPNEDFSAYDKKLADLRLQAKQPTKPKQQEKAQSTSGSSASSAVAASGLSDKERKKFDKTIKKLEQAMSKVDDSLAKGKNPDSRIRYFEKSLEKAKSQYPGQDFSTYEQKLSSYKAGKQQANRQADFDKFNEKFDLELGSISPAAIKSAQALLNDMRARYPDADYTLYEKRIAELSDSKAAALQDSVLRDKVLNHLESLEKQYGEGKTFYFSDVDKQFSTMHQRIADFKQQYPDADMAPYEQRLSDLRKRVDESVTNMAGNVRKKAPDQGMTSAVHEKYAGKIVFSNKPVPLGSEKASNFIQNYDLGDDLYFRVYLKESKKNAFSANTLAEQSGKHFVLKGTANLFMTLGTAEKKAWIQQGEAG